MGHRYECSSEILSWREVFADAVRHPVRLTSVIDRYTVFFFEIRLRDDKMVTKGQEWDINNTLCLFSRYERM